MVPIKHHTKQCRTILSLDHTIILVSSIGSVNEYWGCYKACFLFASFLGNRVTVFIKKNLGVKPLRHFIHTFGGNQLNTTLKPIGHQL